MNFNTPQFKDNEEYEAEMVKKLEAMVAARRSGRTPIEPEVDEKLEAIRKLAGTEDVDYSGMDIGEQLTEDIVAPDIESELPSEPIMDDKKSAQLKALQKYLTR